ncbi:acyltransferase family protein [Tundrisphaera sp. TA3]|uniref:acyltransferase family protein n=1 Tax=Tundrisphaera sp. TA3 TaxID=3435775 RepID=UPI003EBD2E63
MKRLPELDGLRGLAALVIVLFHYWNTTFALGWPTVYLFFVLSGYLITSILLAHPPSLRFLASFQARRCLRIWPIYYATILASIAFNMAISDRHRLDALPYYLTFTQNVWGYAEGPRPDLDLPLEHTWTLAIEEQFYLFWPALVGLAGRRRIVPLCLAFIAVPILARRIWHPPWLLLSQCDGFAYGGLLAGLGVAPDASAGRRRWLLPLLTSACLGSLGFLVAGYVLARLRWTTPGLLIPWKLPILNLFCFGLVGATVLQAGRAWLRPLRSPGMIYLGQISYGLYLFHAVIMAFAIEAAHPSSLAGTNLVKLAAFAASLAAAGLSWRYFERPILGLKDRFRYRGSEPDPAPDRVVPTGGGRPKSMRYQTL